MTKTVADAQAILRANDRGGYTVPTAGLYPYQWNWDSAFCALGWMTFDEPRAWREFDRLLEGQWADGMVPHIVFHRWNHDYFPGPDIWCTRHDPPTSGITQPAVLATAVRRCWESGNDRVLADAKAAALYPKLLAWHRWWVAARDPEQTGLVGILHPWESGMDNSPAWDEAFVRVPPEPRSAIRRTDTGHVDPSMRPSEDFYKRVIALVDLYASLDWDPARLWESTPFKIADVALNAILHRAHRDLLALAERFGSTAERAEITDRLNLSAAAIARLWSDAEGIYEPLDLIARKPIAAATSAGFLPVWAGVADAGHVAAMTRKLERWTRMVRHLVPSTSPEDTRFEPKRYWRGPVWAIVNWMIAQGFAESGAIDTAQRIRDDTAALISRAGFCEYFDPLNGDGLGGGDFSWTAAVALTWSLLAG
jgi:mannosylglycerate hydrolase